MLGLLLQVTVDPSGFIDAAWAPLLWAPVLWFIVFIVMKVGSWIQDSETP